MGQREPANVVIEHLSAGNIRIGNLHIVSFTYKSRYALAEGLFYGVGALI